MCTSRTIPPSHADRPHSACTERTGRLSAIFELGQRKVRRVRLSLRRSLAPRRIKLPHQLGIRAPRPPACRHPRSRCPPTSPSESRKVGSPLSALIPAPVSTKTRSSAASSNNDATIPSKEIYRSPEHTPQKRMPHLQRSLTAFKVGYCVSTAVYTFLLLCLFAITPAAKESAKASP